MEKKLPDLDERMEARDKKYYKERQGYGVTTLALEIVRLEVEIKDKEFEIEQLRPRAELEEVLKAYRRPRFELEGSTVRLRDHEKELVQLQKWLRQAIVMSTLVQAEQLKAQIAATQREYDALEVRKALDPEMDAWHRYHVRGERPTIAMPGMGQRLIPGPVPPAVRPSKERFERYHALLADYGAYGGRTMGQSQRYHELREAHPEFIDILDAQVRAEILERMLG